MSKYSINSFMEAYCAHGEEMKSNNVFRMIWTMGIWPSTQLLVCSTPPIQRHQ